MCQIGNESGIRALSMILMEEKKNPIPVQTNTIELLKGKTALITGGSGEIDEL